MSNETIHTCVDVELPPELRFHAPLLAIDERADNRPAIDPKLLPPGVDGGAIAALTGKLWKSGRTLRVRFLDGDPAVQKKIIPYAQVWSQYANLKFEFGDDSNAEIRITFKLSGSWSYIGTDNLSIPKNQPTMNYGWLTANSKEDEYSRVVTHEFGHAIGLIHEHQNPAANIPWNKEAVYNYYKGPPNNWDKATVDNNLFTKYSATQTQFSQFDKQSIMLYPIDKKFVTDTSFEVGWNKFLSDTDKQFISVLYPFENKTPRELTSDGKPINASIGSKGEVDLYSLTVAETGKYRIETQGFTDTLLDVLGPDNDAVLVAQDNNSGWFANARIERSLAPGKYTVRVRHFSPARTGGYSITASKI